MKNTTSGKTRKPSYTLEGTAVDIETIIRLRKWMEDEVVVRKGQYARTQLITDYDAVKNIFKFQLQFFK